MKNWTARISDTTAAAVHDVLAGQDVDAFTDEALRREALRHKAGRKLNEAIEEGRDSGLVGGTLDELIASMRDGAKAASSTEHPAA